MPAHLRHSNSPAVAVVCPAHQRSIPGTVDFNFITYAEGFLFPQPHPPMRAALNRQARASGEPSSQKLKNVQATLEFIVALLGEGSNTAARADLA